eukprot:scaffold2115_cov92-Amphora_coffeaeformis.AAC.1
MGLAGLREGGQGQWARGWAGARVAVGVTGPAAMKAISTTISTAAVSTTAVSAVATGGAMEVPEKWVAAALKGRTNVANRGKSERVVDRCGLDGSNGEGLKKGDGRAINGDTKGSK